MLSAKFFKKFIKNPISIGAVSPSSSFLCKKIGNIIDNLEHFGVVEVGSGTGSITKEIIHKNPKLVEIDGDLCNILRVKFPDLRVINSCALDQIDNIDEEVGVVFSIPLINNPMKQRFINVINKKYLENKIKWCVIYTYGLSNPLKGVEFSSQKREAFCLLNLPPAHVWVYS